MLAFLITPLLFPDALGILPKSQAPGVDFCGVDDNYYIVRSDIGVYMKATNFAEGKITAVYELHNACKGGEHYLAHQDGLFYIIKGSSYRRVTNMATDAGAVVYQLHPNCQGGDHYLSAYGNYYIIFESLGVYRKTSNMASDTDGVNYRLDESCKGGLYYWGTKKYTYFVKPLGQWGLHYHKTDSLASNSNAADYSFNKDVIRFLPGGVALTVGKAYGKWNKIKAIKNTSQTALNWSKKISMQVGSKKETMSSIEHNWNVQVSLTFSSGGVAAAFARQQFSMSASYGGKKVDTTTKSWSESKTVEEQVNLKVEPGQTVFIWQYSLGLGDDDILFGKDLEMTTSNMPPTKPPLSV